MSSFLDRFWVFNAAIQNLDQPSKDYAQNAIAYHQKNGFSVYPCHIFSLFRDVSPFYDVPSPSLRPFCDVLPLIFLLTYV